MYEEDLTRAIRKLSEKIEELNSKLSHLELPDLLVRVSRSLNNNGEQLEAFGKLLRSNNELLDNMIQISNAKKREDGLKKEIEKRTAEDISKKLEKNPNYSIKNKNTGDLNITVKSKKIHTL
ncbi:MAG: hypothetical protein J6Y03_05545 [Alphaproteobacteria bacterium]|nr:hypothetical protein [Alphaproteobacteria bacterium]